MQTMSPNAPATIWVPARAESGIPRGGVLLQEGVNQVKQGLSGGSSQPAAAPAVAPAAAAPAGAVATAPPAPGQAGMPAPRPGVQYQVVQLPAPVPIAVKKRIAVIESGQNGLIDPFSDQIRVLGIGVPLDISSQSAAASKENDRPAFAGELWKDNVAAVLVVVSAPDGVGSGQTLMADIYDGIEKSRLRRVSTVIPPAAGADKVSRDASLATALADLSLRVGDVVNLTPWYGRIFAVEGERVYLNAGRESGIQVGQKLKVFRGGKMMAGIGFDPGTQVTTLEIAGFVGTNGSYGVVRDGQSVNLSDTVSYN
jgi:hypothetical protein